MWKSHPKAGVTLAIFQDLFFHHFIFKDTLFTTALLLNSAPGCPPFMDDSSKCHSAASATEYYIAYPTCGPGSHSDFEDIWFMSHFYSGSKGEWWIRSHFPTTLEGPWASLVAQMVKRLPAMQETWVQSLGWEDSHGEGNGNPLQYSCLENPMVRGAWWVTVRGVAKSLTWLSDFPFHLEGL